MKRSLIALTIALFSFSAVAEEGGEHGEEKKPPPAPSKDSPVAQVLKLPVVAGWKQWMKANGGYLLAWGESISSPEGQKCWGVAVGETQKDGMHVWKHFCVPAAGGDIWVATAGASGEVAYKLYDAWVKECEPTENSSGHC
jgi:hypothetical protein